MGNNVDKIFIDLMPLEEKQVFLGGRKSKTAKFDQAAAKSGLAKLLTGTFQTKDGLELAPKDIIDMKATAYVMANPSPQNVKALYELAGLAAPKEVDVTSGGKPIDKFLEGLAIKKNEDVN